MSAFIDCMVCDKRIIYKGERDDRGMSDAEVAEWFRGQGCSVGPTRCPDHVRDKGLAAARRSFAACTADHDPQPWLVLQGIANGGGTVFNGGGAQSGRRSLSPRAEFCQEHSHYWNLNPPKAVSTP